MSNLKPANGTSLTTANGSNHKLNLVLHIKDGTHDTVATKVSTEALAIFNAYDTIQKGYYTLLPEVAKAIYSEAWKCLDGCKSFGQFLIQITGCSKATASELSKVAKYCYTSKGALIDGYELFTYSELIKISALDEEDRQKVIDRIKAIGEKHTRKDVLDAIEEQKFGETKGLEDKKSKTDMSITTTSVPSGTQNTTSSEDAPKLQVLDPDREGHIYNEELDTFEEVPSPSKTTAYWIEKLKSATKKSRTDMVEVMLDLCKFLEDKELYIVDCFYMTKIEEE